MAYIQYKYRFTNSVEYEFHYAGKYGAKGEQRAKREKKTADAVKRFNQKKKKDKVRRLIKANFRKFDYFITLKYAKGTRKDLKEVQADLKKFLYSLRQKYKKKEKQLKFIYRLEIGKRGGIHCHMILPRLHDGDIIIQSCWKHGRINFQNLYDKGNYEQLASYITKEPDEEVGKQLSFFPEDEQKHFIKYSTSRNLIRPIAEKKTYSRWTLKKLIDDGIKPSEGYYIDKSSIRSGVNQWTGMSYLYYTEILIREKNEEG
ncbi:MAG: hypothetical protein MJZ37_07780 [Bacilli bacterium]|nr:hypothetical protein [Bacilli bacterium]